MTLKLDERLKADTYQLGSLDDSLLLLSKNALFPWFILVPNTQEIELHKLNAEHQSKIQQQTSTIAQFIETHFTTDKINIAAIGNIVSQLHIHIIGRKQNDVCWPGVVWGTSHHKDYAMNEVNVIKSTLENKLNGEFCTTSSMT